MNRIPIDFIQLDSTDSTNEWARRNILAFNASHLTCITAKEQTAGRGRQGKKWVSPRGVNLYATLYFVIPEGAAYLFNIGQILMLGCAEIFLGMGVQTQLKWPNDLLVEGKKIGGVLTETVHHSDSSVGVIVGFGLNVNMTEEMLKCVDQPATSLWMILHQKVDPLSLLQPILDRFIADLGELRLRGFSSFQKRFQNLLAYRGEMVTLRLSQQEVRGICQGVTPEGHLELQLGEKRVTVSAGEIL